MCHVSLSGIGDQHVDTAEARLDLGSELPACLGIEHVAGGGEYLALGMGLGEPVARGFQTARVTAAKRHAGARFEQQAHGFEADSRGATGDHGHTSFDLKTHKSLFSWLGDSVAMKSATAAAKAAGASI